MTTPNKFENAVGGDGHFVIEWTAEPLEILKRDGKRIVCSFKSDGHGGIMPTVSIIDAIDVPVEIKEPS